MKWAKDGLSIDETKISVIILAFLGSLGFGMYAIVTKGDVPNNLTTIITTLAFIVMGEFGLAQLTSKLGTNLPRDKSSTFNYYEEDSK